MEHPPEIEGSSIYRVPFVRVSCQSEPMESLSTEPNCKRRKAVGPTMSFEFQICSIEHMNYFMNSRDLFLALKICSFIGV